MQDGDMTDFDLKVRSLLEDAEEPVPSRLWSSVSARLDKAGAAPVVAPVWKWAGAALAAAAVVAGALLLVPTSDREGEILERGAVALNEILPIENIIEEAPASEAAAAVPVVANRGTAAGTDTRLADAAPETGKAEEPASPESAGSDKDVPQKPQMTSDAGNGQQEPASGTEKPAVKKTDVKEPDGTWTDPFAQTAPKAGKAAFRPSAIFAQGTLAGNDNGGPKTLQSRYGMRKASDLPGIQEKSVSTYDIPVTFGLGVKFSLSERLSLGTGLEWSLLSRSFDGIYTKSLPDGTLVPGTTGLITHNLQYIGIPVNVYFDVISGKSTSFYIWGGGDAQKCISNTYRISVSEDSFSKAVNGMQFSVGAGFGVEFALAERLGVYIDPSVRYWFGNGQPKSIRTEEPLTIGFEAGLRFDL